LAAISTCTQGFATGVEAMTAAALELFDEG